MHYLFYLLLQSDKANSESRVPTIIGISLSISLCLFVILIILVIGIVLKKRRGELPLVCI